MSGISALATSGTYEATVPTATPAETKATVTGEATFVEIFEQAIQVAKGSVTYDAGRIQLDVALSRDPSVSGRLAGNLVLDAGARTVGIDALTITFQNAAWRLAPGPGRLQSAGTPKPSPSRR